MEYIVWKQEEYGDLWRRFDCKDETEVTAVVLELLKVLGDIEVTKLVAYKVRVSLVEGKVPPLEEKGLMRISPPGEKEQEEPSATKESEPEDDKGSRGKSHRSV